MKRSTLLLLLGMLALPVQGADTAESVLDCVRANVPSTARVQAFELITFDRKDTPRTLSGQLYALREERMSGRGLLQATLHVDKPVEFEGAAYLVKETDDYLRDGMYLYLPAVRRVRRVTGTFADGALFGSNFSYHDFKQMANAFGDLQGTLEGQEQIEGRPVHVMSFKPLEGVEMSYSAVRAWIDRQSCVPLKVEFFSGAKARKLLTSPAASIRQAGPYAYAEEIEMRDLVEGTRSLIRFGRVTSDGSLPKRYFDPTAFHLGR